MLWVSCDNQKGLNSYDSRTEKFTCYVRNQAIDKSLLVMYQSSDGLLWFGGWDGLTVYDKKKGTFTRYHKGQAGANNFV